EGVVGVKAFLCDSGLAEYARLDEFALLEAMHNCAQLGLLLALHAEDASETHRMGQLARSEGRRGVVDWAHSRAPSTEIEAVQRAQNRAREAGAGVHLVHISTGTAARLAQAARANGDDVSFEPCPHYLMLDEGDLEQRAPPAKCAPPLRTREHVEDLWC